MVRTLLAGRALLLVDGIDEAPEKTRGELRDRLRRLLRVFSGNGCLVTSRPSAVSEGWLSGGGLAEEDFVELSLAPMSRDRVTRFIRDWHSAARLDEQSRSPGRGNASGSAARWTSTSSGCCTPYGSTANCASSPPTP